MVRPVKKMLFLFIDGVGMGDDTGEHNPFVTQQLPFIHSFFPRNPFTRQGTCHNRHTRVLALDACLETPGLPQSATGQTALFAGLNPCRVTGRHIHAFPTQALRDMLAEHSILRRLKQCGLRVTSANAYSKRYFEKVKEISWLKFSASTLTIMAADLPFRMKEQLLAGEAVFHDLTNRNIRRFHPEVPLITPREAADNLSAIALQHDFTLFEYFRSDMHGHSRKADKIENVLYELDLFLGRLLPVMLEQGGSVLISSDHGNLEDISTGSHTRNPVPGIIVGPEAMVDDFAALAEQGIDRLYHWIIAQLCS